MRWFSVPVLLLLAGAAQAQCTPDGRWIALELVASEPAGGEPVEVIDIDPAGCATIRYAGFDLRAGVYRRQLAASELDALRGTIDTRALLDFDTASVRAAIDANEDRMRRSLVPGAAERFSVQCGDTYRITIEEAHGAVAIEWYAPLQVAERHADIAALTGLADFIAQVRKLADAEGRVRVAELAP